MPILIRPATAADEAALVEQFQGLNQHEAPITHDRRTDREAAVLSLAAAHEKVAECGGHALVAERQGTVVGHLFLLFLQDSIYVVEELRLYAYIAELYVRPEARGHGIATALMAEAERLAIARGMNRILLSVVAGNTNAEALYARLAYTPHVITLAKPLPPLRSPPETPNSPP